MAKRNHNLAKLQSGYLFPEIARRRKAFMEANPNAKVISLGIGDTTEAITPHIISGMQHEVSALSKNETYSGYGDEQGLTALREKIASEVYHGLVKGEEVFVSDGAKPDTGRLQLLFSQDAKIAVQDPSYPVYVDSSVMFGKTGDINAHKQFEKLVYMPCNPTNGFFPDLSKVGKVDVMFFCSPNNPTGAVATKEQLEELVAFCKKHKTILIFDSAYGLFIPKGERPRSIYEIEGAKEVAIEVSSFSKPIGFTGVRLGWSVVPNELCYEDGTQVRKDWNRIMTTIFNGASNVAQHGALAALDSKGIVEMQHTIDHYMGNAAIIRKTMLELGFRVYGGDYAPYIWVEMKGMSSWDAFEHILNKAHVVTTPGSGFGPSGEGFLRFSAFGHRKNVEEACMRLRKVFSS